MDLDDIPTLDLDTLAADLVKAGPRGGKYYRRVPTGNPKRPWRYYYTKEEYDRAHGEAAHVNGREIAQHREREKSGEVKLTKKELLQKLKSGTFSIISAGRNPNHPDEGHLDVNDPKFEARHEELRRELQKRGMKYTEVIGHYGGKEKSFLVYHHDEAKPEKQVGERAMMVHHDSPSHFGVIRELGKKFNQDSVIHSHAGKHEMHFTTGPNAGKHLKGDGHEIKPHAEDFYTHTPTKRGATKFALNFDWDNYHAYESAMHKSRFVITRERMLKADDDALTARLKEKRGGDYEAKAKHAGHMSLGVVDSIPDTHTDAAAAHRDAARSARAAGRHEDANSHEQAAQMHEQRAASLKSTKKSMAHDAAQNEEMDMLESTPELREQIKMVIAQEDPMAKGLYAFEPGYGKQGVNKIPDDYLAAYLDAFIEEAFEHEKRERCHDENAAIMGISQPNGANGGIGGDEADWWAQWVMNELVIYCGKNENIMRACTKLNATKDFVASRLRAMGLVKPSFNGGTINGDFMEGYQFSEEQTAAGIGKSLTADAGAFPSAEEMIKSVQRTNSVLADGGETVRLDDDGVNPVEMLANVHRTRFALMQDVFGLDLGINTKR